MLALLIYGGLVLLSFLVVAWLLIRYLLERLRVDPYPPEAAEAPTALDEHFKTAPREQRIDEAEVERLLKAFDWPRYATWLKEPS